MRNQQWLFAFLPAFPLVLLVLRLWYLSEQDLPTMLLLVQYVNPLGLISALITTLMWVLPILVLGCRFLGGLLLLSTPPEANPTRSWLVRASSRIPDWVVVLMVVLAGLTWQMRFLPVLLLMTVSIAALTVRARHGDRRRLVAVVGIGLPLVVAAGAYTWLAPAIVDAFRHGELPTALLLLLPPGLTVLLTGPVHPRGARLVTHWPATVGALLSPVMIGAVFLATPVLPIVAMEVDTDARPETSTQVVRGHTITVDDSMTTVLDHTGTIQFIVTGRVRSQTLCPEAARLPGSAVTVHDWPVEQTMLEWLAPARRPAPLDPRCLGRNLTVTGTPPKESG